VPGHFAGGRVGDGVGSTAVLGTPLVGASGGLVQFPFKVEQVLEVAVN
jgi:hypothetical protein